MLKTLKKPTKSPQIFSETTIVTPSLAESWRGQMWWALKHCWNLLADNKSIQTLRIPSKSVDIDGLNVKKL